MSIDLLTVPYVMMEHVPIDMLTDVATTEVLEACSSRSMTTRFKATSRAPLTK